MTRIRATLAVLATVSVLRLTGPAPAMADPTPGGTLTVAYNTEQRNLNPAVLASNAVFLIGAKVVEPLVDLGTDGTLKPVLATGWQAAPDGRAITVTLRPAVKWHDGTDFTSADVAFSALEIWRKVQNFGRVVFKDLEAVDTPDATTAVFRFAKPVSAQMVLNALPDLSSVAPRHLYEGTDIAGNPHNLTLVGTGPFKMTELKRGEYVILDRNPDYWDKPKPYLNRLVFRVMPDKAAIAAAQEAGEVQLSTFTSVPLGELERLARLPGLAVIGRGYEALTYHATIELNQRRPELAKREVRQAIAHALDAAFLADSVFSGYARPGTGPVPSTSALFYTPDVPRYPFDPAKAEKLLDEAGYPRRAEGVRFTLKLVPAPWFDYTKLLGDYVRQALKKVGIATEVRAYDSGGHLSVVYKDHDFDITTGSHAFRNDPAISTTILYQSGIAPGVPWSNQSDYRNPAMDQLIAAAAGEIDPARRVDLYRQFQKLAQQDLPLIPLIEHGFVSVAADTLRDHHNTPRWAASSWSDLWLEP